MGRKTATRPWTWKPKDDESRSVDIPLSADFVDRLKARLGIAMAAMIKIITTTISNSINEKPLCFLYIVSPRIESRVFTRSRWQVRSSYVGVLRGGLRKLCDEETHKPFVALLQFRELPAEALDLATLLEASPCPQI